MARFFGICTTTLRFVHGWETIAHDAMEKRQRSQPDIVRDVKTTVVLRVDRFNRALARETDILEKEPYVHVRCVLYTWAMASSIWFLIAFRGWDTVLQHVGMSIFGGFVLSLYLHRHSFGAGLGPTTATIMTDPDGAGALAARKGAQPINLAPLKTEATSVIDEVYTRLEPQHTYCSDATLVDIIAERTISILAADSVLERIVVQS